MSKDGNRERYNFDVKFTGWQWYSIVADSREEAEEILDELIEETIRRPLRELTNKSMECNLMEPED